MTVTSAAPSSSPEAHTTRALAKPSRSAFRALLLRDLTVMKASGREVLVRTFMHPLLLVFVFTYVFPKIGQGVELRGGLAAFSAVLIAGVVALALVFQGLQAVALPLVAELGATNEIEDRVLAPIPIWMVAVAKIAAGAVHSLLTAVVVFPVAALIPATPVHLRMDWPVLVTLLPLACVASAALGLTFGTFFEPRSVPALLGIFLLPLIFLGGVYYPWATLTPIPWLKWAVLVNPLVYVSEGLRAALGAPVPHMPLVAVYGALGLFAAAFSAVGVQRFKQRVLS